MELSETSKYRVREAAHILISSFTWSDTKEGHNYWSEVVFRLEEMVRK